MIKRITTGAIAFLIVFGGVAGTAQATENTVCVPSEAVAGYWVDVPDITHPAVGEPTIVIDNPDYVPGTEASTIWYNFSPNKHQKPFEGPPVFPNDERGTWQGPHTEGGPNQDQEGVFQQGNGHGSWFYRENTPATEPQGEPTITVDNPDYQPERIEVTPDTWVDPVDAVTCPPVIEEPPVEEPPVVVPPVVTPEPKPEPKPVAKPAPKPAPKPVVTVTTVTPEPKVEAKTLAATGTDDVNWLLIPGALAVIGTGAWMMRHNARRA